MGDLASLVHALRTAASFEAAAVLTLQQVEAIVAATARTGAAGGGRVLRTMLHLRPNEGYSGVFVLEAGADRLSTPGQHEALLPSASVWRWLSTHDAAVEVDVTMRALRVDGELVGRVQWRDTSEPITDGSVQRLLDRDATHVYAVPLHATDGLAGMISVEVNSVMCIGRPFPWGRATAELISIAETAGPYLSARPARAEPAAEVDPLLPVVGPSMVPLVEVIRAFAAVEETLLIRGETGTGKSRLARFAHARSPRAAGPFEVVDLLSVPEETQMGELFGWTKGAFTSATRDHEGFVARAEGGTLFIDEIDKLSLKAQAALLFLLEDRTYRPLGAQTTRAADVRFVVGTNVNLQAAVDEGRFREDLYYRIDVLPVRLPPLRERRDEIGDWARFMAARVNTARKRQAPTTMTDAACALLAKHDWPGNLRELDNVVRRAYTLASVGAVDGVTVDAAHVERARGLGGGRSAGAAGGSAIEQLRSAFAALVDQLVDGAPDLEGIDIGGALHGLLLAEATLRAGGRDEAFSLLGRGEQVRARNHHRVMKREWAKAVALLERVGIAVPMGLADAAE